MEMATSAPGHKGQQACYTLALGAGVRNSRWAGGAQSRCRCGQEWAQSRCRCGSVEPSQSRCRSGPMRELWPGSTSSLVLCLGLFFGLCGRRRRQRRSHLHPSFVRRCRYAARDLRTASRAARSSVSVRNPSADVACAAAVSAQPRGGREAVPPTSCVCDRASTHVPVLRPAWKRALCVCARVLVLGVSGMGGVNGDPPSTRSLNQSTVQNGRTSDLRAKRYSTRQPDETRGPRRIRRIQRPKPRSLH